MTSSHAMTIVIPARYGSQRFPGKPLAMVAGRSLLERTWRIARAVADVAGVYVATDDARIADHVRGFGGEVIDVDEPCRNGSERVAAAVRKLSPTPASVINLQGDAVLTPPWIIDSLVQALARTRGIVTPAVLLDADRLAELRASKIKAPASGTTVVFDRHQRALYFSKHILPFARSSTPASAGVYRHIGIYGYDLETLNAFVALPPSPLEESEGLEQLRALENGIAVQVTVVEYRGRTHASIDDPRDIALVEAIIAREGELVP